MQIVTGSDSSGALFIHARDFLEVDPPGRGRTDSGGGVDVHTSNRSRELFEEARQIATGDSLSFPSRRPYLPESGKEHVAAQTDDESPNVATTAIPLESGEGTYDQTERDQVIV